MTTVKEVQYLLLDDIQYDSPSDGIPLFDLPSFPFIRLVVVPDSGDYITIR